MRKIVLFIATSLDGYIARNDDTLDWLFAVEGEGDNGYQEFYDTVDTVVMGNRTYEWIQSEVATGFPYVGKNCYIFRHERNGDHKSHSFDTQVEFIEGSVVEHLNRLKAEPKEGDIWIVGGGSLIQQCMEQHLIEELYITVAPTIIGGGISLFGELKEDIKWKLIGVKTYNQFVELHYRTQEG